MFRAEATGVRMEKLTPRIKDTALRLWGIYLAMTVVCALLLWGEGMTPFDALNHAMSTISTGGFSTRNDSLGFYTDNLLILWTTTVFMLLSGINFLAHLKLVQRDPGGYTCDEARWYLRSFVLLSLLLTYYLFIYDDTRLSYALTHAS